MWSYISRSTLKREAAAVLMLWLLGMASYLIVTSEPTIALQVWMALVLPITGIFGMAFGMDWISKQTNLAGPPSTKDPTQQ